jgi:hypothetical protein
MKSLSGQYNFTGASLHPIENLYPPGDGVWPMNSSKAASWSGEAVVERLR